MLFIGNPETDVLFFTALKSTEKARVLRTSQQMRKNHGPSLRHQHVRNTRRQRKYLQYFAWKFL
jgi:hypothetical protein